MEATILHSHGPDSTFEQAWVLSPEVEDRHVLGKTAASSVNTVDTMIRNRGKDLPLSP